MPRRDTSYTAVFPGCEPWHMCQGYGHGERIFDAAFHPLNDDIVLTASEDTSVRMWRRSDGSTMYKQARAYLGHAGEVLRVAWASNGLIFVSGSADRTVRLWAADLYDPGYTGRQLAVLDGHPEEVYHVEMVDPNVPPTPYGGAAGGAGGGGAAAAGSPFESHVLSASCESLFVWSLHQGALVQQADAPGTSGSTVTQADIQAGARPSYIFGTCRQPGGSLLATACSDGAVRLWSLRPTGRLDWVAALPLPGQPMCTGCAFSADGARLGVVTRQGGLFELDVRTRRLLSRRQMPSSPLTIAFLPRGACAGPAAAADGVPAAAAAGAAAAGAAAAPAAMAAGAGEAGPGSPPELWLVACRDGAVYGYGLEGKGDEPACVVRPPAAEGVSLLAVAVASSGRAVAVAGEPQNAALLPPMRQQPSASQPPAEAAGNGAAPGAQGSSDGGSSSGSNSMAGAAAEPAASAPAAPAATSSSPPPSNPPATAAPAAAAAAPAAAPARRRGKGSGRVVAGGLTSRDPLALFEEGAEQTPQPVPPAEPSGGESTAGSLAAMSLGDRPGASQPPQGREREQGQGPQAPAHGQALSSGAEQPGGRGGPGAAAEESGSAQNVSTNGPQGEAGARSQSRSQGGSQTQSGGQEGDTQEGDTQDGDTHEGDTQDAPPVRMRAALFVYRAGDP